MINVIIADHQAIFRAGVAKVLAVEDDLRIVGQPQTTEQMLNALERLRAHVLLVSTFFLPEFAEIQVLTSRNSIATLVLAENGDEAFRIRCHGRARSGVPLDQWLVHCRGRAAAGAG